jgi:lipopolysaccharide/colanic/teichoic acid biosynthesis glycosyltransferase
MAESAPNQHQDSPEATDTAAFTDPNEIDLGAVIAALSVVQTSWAFFAAKRAFDIVLAIAILIVGMPLFAAVIIAIKIDSRGPVLFKQERVRQGLRTFLILKFRTMHVEARPYPLAIFDKDSGAYRRPRLNEDPRVTAVGRMLRRYSIDELPQVINILKGEMSFIGPRPLTLPESRMVPSAALVRYAVPSGISGIAQLRQRNAIVGVERFDGDVEYVRQLGLKQELKIFVQTFGKLYDRSI